MKTGGKRKKESPAELCCVTVAFTQLSASDSRACRSVLRQQFEANHHLGAGIMHCSLEGLSAVVHAFE